MIVGLTGAICSGKDSMADYLVKNHNFQKVNIMDLFRKKIEERRKNKVQKMTSEQESPMKHFDIS